MKVSECLLLLILSTLIITVELPVFREQFRVFEELAAVAAVATVLLPEVGEVGVKFLLGRGDRVVGGAVLTGGLQGMEEVGSSVEANSRGLFTNTRMGVTAPPSKPFLQRVNVEN